MPLSSAGSVLAFAASLSLLLFAVGMLFQRLRQRDRLLDAERLRLGEARLQEQRRLLDLFIQNAPASIAMLDKEMHYIHASRRWLQDYRLDYPDIVGRSHYEVFPEIPERWKAIHRRCLAGATERCAEDPFPRQDGQVDWLMWEIRPWHDASGEIGGIIIMTETITERKRAELALREGEERRRALEARMMQNQKQEALAVLVAGIAHNFNNLLTIIMGAASVQEQAAADPAGLETFRLIGTACQRGRALVRALTQFARPSLAQQAPVDMGLLLAEVRLLLGSAGRPSCAVVFDVDDGPLWVFGDAGGISTVLMNICLNAMDAMPQGGTLSVRAWAPQPDWIEVRIEDTGEGMSPVILARVTEPFFTTKEVGRGTGLGLSMSQGVIRAHGGTLELASAPGQGTQVTLRLPRTAAPAPVPGLPAPGPGVEVPGTVLLVDDDEDVRLLMVRMLQKAGVRHAAAVPGGAEALECLRAGETPDLVILDQNMPGLDGIETLAQIRAMRPDLPVLISSGQPGIQQEASFKRPKVAVISKPFTMGEIMAKLGEL